MYFRDPFKLVPFQQLSEGLERLRRNEIIDANESRQRLGLVPSSEEKANELYNPNQYRQDMPIPGQADPNGEYTNGAPEDMYVQGQGIDPRILQQQYNPNYGQ